MLAVDDVDERIDYVGVHGGQVAVLVDILVKVVKLRLSALYNEFPLALAHTYLVSLGKFPVEEIMPGLLAYDFGDAIRFGANTAEEDETDLSLVSLDCKLFETYVSGFISGCAGAMTKREQELLPEGALVMTYENGLRFLTDYLAGDVYFKTDYPRHNLDRCRTQFALLKDMERMLPSMHACVRRDD